MQKNGSESLTLAILREGGDVVEVMDHLEDWDLSKQLPREVIATAILDTLARIKKTGEG